MPASARGARDAGLIPESEDSLEYKMASHSSILAWKIPWTEEPDGLLLMGSERVVHNWVTNIHIHRHYYANCQMRNQGSEVR